MGAIAGAIGVKDAARIVAQMLKTQNGRGEHAAGIASSDGERVYVRKGEGLVDSVFADEAAFEEVPGSAATGCLRFPPPKKGATDTDQPRAAELPVGGPIAIVQTGGLRRGPEIRKELLAASSILPSKHDAELLLHLVARPGRAHREAALVDACRDAGSAFAMLALGPGILYAARDPHGYQPLAVARHPKGGWIVASETCAFSLYGAKPFERQPEPGELWRFDAHTASIRRFADAATPRKCAYEPVYFARTDSHVFGESVFLVRRRLGRELALYAPVAADVVVPIPDSSIEHAYGYAETLEIPFAPGIFRNRYAGRAFLAKNLIEHEIGVLLKYNAIEEIVAGKVVVVVDDSILRGSTARKVIAILRNAGAVAVHLRIASPLTRDSCGWGVVQPPTKELLGHRLPDDAHAAEVTADSFACLPVDRMHRALGPGFCDDCFRHRSP